MAKKQNQVVEQSDQQKLERYDRILELGGFVEERQRELDAAKEAAKEAKELWEHAVAELQLEIKRANDPQSEFVFGD